MLVGLALPHYEFSFPDGRDATVGEVVRYAARAESAGFDSVWVSDHLFLDLAKYGGPARRYRTPEALTLLGAVAAATSRVRVGSLVLCAPLRPAAVSAAAAATLHDLSAGRLELGLGAGWYEPEFEAAGVPFGSAGERLEGLRSYVAQVRATLDGRAEARPTIWVGGKGGPRLLRIVAEHADGWNVVWRMRPQDYAQRLEALREACARAGRDPATVRLSLGLTCLMGSDDADLARRYRALQGWAPGGALDGVSLEAYAEGALVGTPRECAARVEAFASLGVEHLIVSLAHLPFSIGDDEQLDLVANELLPLVR